MIIRRIVAVTVPLAGVVGIVTACSSVPDVSFGDDDGGAAVDGNGTPDGNRPDGRADTGTDGPRDVMVDPNCVPTGGPESANCEDGIDNDCNGLVDCADPACNPTHQCVDRAPIGFDLVAVADNRTNACAAGFTDQADLSMLVGANPSCACTCGPDTCRTGTGDVTSSTQASCTGGTTNTRALNRTQSSCAAIPNGGLPVGSNNSRHELATLPATPAACPSSATLSEPAELLGRTCKPPASPNAGGCATTQVCMRRPGNGFAVCAARTNPDGGAPPACAAPYSNRRRAGTAVTSSLTCDGTACSCSGPTACTGSFTIYENANCTGKSEVIDATDSCTPMALAGGAAFTALAYTSTSGGGCTPSGNAPLSGSLDVANESTICCKP